MQNSQLVGMQGKKIVILQPKNQMTPDEALQLAAWLVVMAEAWSVYTFEHFKDQIEAEE